MGESRNRLLTRSFASPDPQKAPLRPASQEATPQLSVVVPVHNEAENIGGLIDEIRSVLEQRLDFEIVVVDDGSTDDTRPILEASLRRGASRHVSHRERCGQTAAMWTGVRAARAPWIATLDGDGQNDPADVLKLLERRHEVEGNRPHLIVGQRRNRRDTWIKRASSRIANGVRGRVLGDRTPDTGCGLKMFAREAFLALPAFDHAHRFLPALFLRAGGTVVSVEVGHRPRLTGRTHYGVFDRLGIGIIDLFGVMWLQRRAIRTPVDVIDARADQPADAGKE